MIFKQLLIVSQILVRHHILSRRLRIAKQFINSGRIIRTLSFKGGLQGCQSLAFDFHGFVGFVNSFCVPFTLFKGSSARDSWLERIWDLTEWVYFFGRVTLVWQNAVLARIYVQSQLLGRSYLTYSSQTFAGVCLGNRSGLILIGLLIWRWSFRRRILFAWICGWHILERLLICNGFHILLRSNIARLFKYRS